MGDPWREGKYVDLWSVVHAHAGFLLAWFLFELGLPLAATVALTLLALAAYEGGEQIAGVDEHATNRITDIVFGMVGLAIAHQIQAVPAGRSIMPVVGVTFVLLNLWGWLAWMRREGRL